MSPRKAIGILAFALGSPAFLGCEFEASGTVRARAASDFGCSDSEIEVERVPGSSYRATGCGQTNLYTCEPGRGGDPVCVSDNANPRSTREEPRASAPPGPPASPLRDPSSGAGGFVFGASEDDARRTCEQAGHAYSADAAGHGSCAGLAAEVGGPARAGLTYCAGKLCAVSLKVARAPQEDVARTLARWKAAVSEKYGDATASHSNVPDECRDDLTFCLIHRSASVRFDWQWRSGQRITLSPQVDDSQTAWVNISYMAPEAVQSRTSGL
jgi:hypothetical protein